MQQQAATHTCVPPPPPLGRLTLHLPACPGRSYDVVRIVRERHPALMLPVIMVSANSREEHIVEGLQVGAASGSRRQCGEGKGHPARERPGRHRRGHARGPLEPPQ